MDWFLEWLSMDGCGYFSVTVDVNICVQELVHSPPDHIFVCMNYGDTVRLCDKQPKMPKDPF